MFTIQHSDSPRAARLGSPRTAHLGSPLAAHSGPRLRLVRRNQPTRTTRLHQSPSAAPQAPLLGHKRGALSLGGRQQVFLANLRLHCSALPPHLLLALPPLLLLEPLLPPHFQVCLPVHPPLIIFFFSSFPVELNHGLFLIIFFLQCDRFFVWAEASFRGVWVITYPIHHSFWLHFSTNAAACLW